MPARSTFDHAIIRVVPRVERGERINVGAIVFCKTQSFLEARIALDEARLVAIDPACDVAAVARALEHFAAVARGDHDAGPIAQLPMPERFHWLTAPRSTIVQTSRVHSGICEDPASTLLRLVQTMVLSPQATTR